MAELKLGVGDVKGLEAWLPSVDAIPIDSTSYFGVDRSGTETRLNRSPSAEMIAHAERLRAARDRLLAMVKPEAGPLRLWLLTRTGATGLDEVSAHVVRAVDAGSAQAHAALGAKDEPLETWLDEASSSCVELTTDGPAGVVLQDVNNG
jgi:hypothetical protein